MKPLFIEYPKCGTCRKAAKWLKDNGIEVDDRHIVDNNPKAEELAQWIKASGIPAAKFFNTSGKKYKEQNLKEVVKTADEQTLINLLASDGMLVKRPILVDGDKVIAGFKEDQWQEFFKPKSV